MERLAIGDLMAARCEFDEAVMRSGARAGSCWLSPWQLAGHATMHGPGPSNVRRHLIYRSDAAWAAWIESSQPGVFVPFEPVWMFASPIVGEPEAAADLALRVLERHRSDLLALVVGGVPLGSELHRALQVLPDRTPGLRYGEAEGTESCLIDLSPADRLTDASEGSWLSRRSPNFRRSIRRTRLPDDVEVIDGATLSPEEAFREIVDVQRRSYKAARDEDIFANAEYRSFYRWLLEDLYASGELRLSLARRGDSTLGFHFGFTRGHHHRGYQMSYAEEARGLGIGTVLHIQQLRRAALEGVTRFDLGMQAPYKKRWCDRVERGVIVFLQ